MLVLQMICCLEIVSLFHGEMLHPVAAVSLWSDQKSCCCPPAKPRLVHIESYRAEFPASWTSFPQADFYDTLQI